ncbi:wax ester synthase/diacylglycerol acyltransferase 5-like [Impatiens glandulifera]|uniref:wax ester synthase/diacylglycerol acyltransferase 5-like n=1 Tax=Impatiens glandulifera TaxID=253017 RepID=UPI001FB11D31|nr:wax ester synthase/diacylglycerol acyltransferase 5-like [Impatiens glandulifera]
MDALDEADEPLTPTGRMLLNPEMDQIIHSVIGVDCPIDVQSVKDEISKSVMIQHPRFSSLLVRDDHGRERWRKIQVEIDRHIIVHQRPITGDSLSGLTDEEAVNEYIADLAVSSPLSTDKPLWEVNILLAHKCAVLRVHHALGDGVSLVSLFLSCCRRADDPSQLPTILTVGEGSSSSSSTAGSNLSLGRLLKTVWLTALYVLEFVLRSLFLKDKRTVMSGGDGVEHWPRKVATAKFNLEDMKAVKRAVTGSTINDVLLAVISSGLSKYLQHRSPKAVEEGLRITGVAFVNLRKQPGLQELSNLMNKKSGSRWGNKFGIVLLPLHYHTDVTDPLQHVRRTKAMVDNKKLSMEAWFSYILAHLVTYCFGSKVATKLIKSVVNNTTFTISNVYGPQEVLTFAGHTITYMRVNTSSLSHATTMHMLSYAGKAELQILVAKDIIPDPHVLANLFENALLEMKEAALEQAE